MREILCAWLFLPVLVSAQALDVAGKARLHAMRGVGPVAWLESAALAGVGQWWNDPREWGQGGAGYGRRYASSLSSIASRNLFEFGLDSALRHDPRYIPAKGRGFWHRTGNALAQTCITRTDKGGHTVAIARLGSAYGAGFLSNLWYPRRLAGTGHAFSDGTLTLGLDAAANFVTEFWPDMKRMFRHRAAGGARRNASTASSGAPVLRP